ncbi:hypothetical protein [Limnospira sp. PMC 1306.21]|uniref:TolB family protein n=1 Tax=Limnospira sp. PMC 1306.21 TaxID=2981089 RepID=UPI0028E17975|nr:hypothetical protein [Limnospira sp. PMC 1306.21]MDT9318101.1 hypothetical protein [Limnospira sp. PMC 1306.21]
MMITTALGNTRIFQYSKSRLWGKIFPWRRSQGTGRAKFVLAVLLLFQALMVGCSSVAINSSMVDGAINSIATDEQPALSGNGRFFAFVSNREGQNQLFLYDLRRRSYRTLLELRRSLTVMESPSLSYTGRYIVYSANDSGRADIYLYDRLTYRLEMLTRGYRGAVRHPHISPNGRYISFEGSRRGQWDIEIIDRGPNIELDTETSLSES